MLSDQSNFSGTDISIALNVFGNSFEGYKLDINVDISKMLTLIYFKRHSLKFYTLLETKKTNKPFQ
jgi:hypothetical protein